MSSIQISDFKDKFSNPSDILQDALNGSFLEASKVMTPSGLKVFLDGAGALHALGKGEDMVISFLGLVILTDGQIEFSMRHRLVSF